MDINQNYQNTVTISYCLRKNCYSGYQTRLSYQCRALSSVVSQCPHHRYLFRNKFTKFVHWNIVLLFWEFLRLGRCRIWFACKNSRCVRYFLLTSSKVHERVNAYYIIGTDKYVSKKLNISVSVCRNCAEWSARDMRKCNFSVYIPILEHRDEKVVLNSRHFQSFRTFMWNE